MNLDELKATARAMTRPGAGILAADESTGTIQKRFDDIGVDNTEANRRAYRELLFREKEGMGFVSGVILFEETLFQDAADGTPLVRLIEAAGAIPGIKVDEGARPLPAFPGETITEGLDGLAERLERYRGRGARFAKWRAVLTIADDLPSEGALVANAQALARYAALCQAADIVPIVEPEVLMDGDHDIDACERATRATLSAVFDQLSLMRVALEGMVLKPNMITPGSERGKAPPEEVARRTLEVLKVCVPAAVPGIAFLSGGQEDEEATANLDAMHRSGPLPWNLTYSYGRALQHAAQHAWSGKSENTAAAQAAFRHRARMNALASEGKWSPEDEKEP